MSPRAWKPWNGGKFLPVPEDAVGDVRLRNGKALCGVKARDVLWDRPKHPFFANDNFENGGEIVAYNFCPEAA